MASKRKTKVHYTNRITSPPDTWVQGWCGTTLWGCKRLTTDFERVTCRRCRAKLEGK